MSYLRHLVRRLRNHALPDPHDERDVLHASLLREAADVIDALRDDAERYRYLRDEPWCETDHPLYSTITLHKNAFWDDAIDAERGRLRGSWE